MKLDIYNKVDYHKDKTCKNYYENILKGVLAAYKGTIFYKEPMYKYNENMADFIIISKEIGLYFIKIFSYNIEEVEIFDAYWKINDKKKKSPIKEFRDYMYYIRNDIYNPKYDLSNVKCNILYCFPKYPNCVELNLDQDESVCFLNETPKFLKHSLNDEQILRITSIITGADLLEKSSDVFVEEPAETLGEAISLNSQNITKFDADQVKAGFTITNEPERIRGIAGTGKTVLLAIKAARLHMMYPNAKIAFVFYTKSLYDQAIKWISKFFRKFARSEPNWENLLILHCWGGRSVGNGFYYYVCKTLSSEFKTYGEITYESACKELLESDKLEKIFDYVLVDEAQDFPVSFFNLLPKVVRDNKIVIAYDELQTINKVNMPDFSNLFLPEDNVKLKQENDFILKKSYRNTLETLIYSISLGFGFYSDLTQIITSKKGWEALGFDAGDSIFKSGNEIKLNRDSQNSPNKIQEYLPAKLPVETKFFDTLEEEVEYVAKLIQKLVNEEDVLPQDILVISLSKNRNSILNKIQNAIDDNVDTNIIIDGTSARNFFRDNYVTMTTPMYAKGNEAPVVILVDIDYIENIKRKIENREFRNYTFISLTRSNGWLYILGKHYDLIENEIQKIQDNFPTIIFNYPSKEKINEIRSIDIIQNDEKVLDAESKLFDLKKQLISLFDNQDDSKLKSLLDLYPEFKGFSRNEK